MPDAERAKLLALVLGGFVVGTLYALGALGLVLRARYLGPAATRLVLPSIAASTPAWLLPQLGNGRAKQATSAPPTATSTTVAPTLFPTLTPALTGTAQAAARRTQAALPQAQGLAAATPYPTPAGGALPPPTATAPAQAAPPTLAPTLTPKAPTRANR